MERVSAKSSGSSNKQGFNDRSLMKPRGEVSLSYRSCPLSRPTTILRLHLHSVFAQVSQSAFALLFSEMIQYSQNRVESISDLERRYFFSTFKQILQPKLVSKSPPIHDTICLRQTWRLWLQHRPKSYWIDRYTGTHCQKRDKNS